MVLDHRLESLAMSYEKPTGPRPPRPQYSRPRPPGAAVRPPTTNGSAVQKHAQWLARATDAERSGDAIEAENCRQHAEHWYRVSRGQD
jgi:hypothetical protein